MKIGFFTDRYFPQTDGVAVSVDLFAKALRKLGHEVTIFCPQAPIGMKRHESGVVRFRSIPSVWYEDYRDTFPWTAANIHKIREYDLDIVHIHTPAQIGILGLRVALTDDIPIVSTYHTDLVQYLSVYKHIFWGLVPATFAGLLFIKDLRTIRNILVEFRHSVGSRQITKQFLKNGLTTFHNYCDLVIAPSQKIANLLHSYHTKSQVVVIPTGIDAHEKPANWDLRKSILAKDDAKIVLFAGRIGKEKNLELAIRSFAHVAKKLPSAHVVLIGDGPYRNQLEYLAEELGIDKQVHFMGMQSHARVLAAMNQSDVFVFPSLTDTQGLVLNESAMMRLPMIWCDPDISAVTINHKTGLLSKPTITDFASKVTTILSQDTKEMKEAAHKAAQSITIERQAKVLADQYQNLIDG